MDVFIVILDIGTIDLSKEKMTMSEFIITLCKLKVNLDILKVTLGLHIVAMLFIKHDFA
jgi:hypothetical protein